MKHFTITRRSDSIGPFGLFDIETTDGRQWLDLTAGQTDQIRRQLMSEGLSLPFEPPESVRISGAKSVRSERQ